MRIVIVGPGALGSLLTARIALLRDELRAKGADNDVPELCLLDYRKERAEKIRESGLLIEEKGHQTLCTVQVETDPEVCSRCDVLFLCVKSTSVNQALEPIEPYLSSEKLLVAMQNGIGHLDSISGLPCACAVGITSEGATLVSPGHVRHGGKGITRIGLLAADSERLALLEKIAALLNASGLETAVTTSPLKYVWAKLFINVAINALTAIHHCSNGELLNSQRTKDIMAKAVKEAVAVAQALDVEVEGDPVSSAFRVCELTANNISSMHQDVRNKKQTEIDAINGAVLELGERMGIATPVNADLVHQVKLIESSYIN